MSSEKYYEGSEGIKYVTYKKVTEGDKMLFDGVLYREVYIYNPPVPKECPATRSKSRGSTAGPTRPTSPVGRALAKRDSRGSDLRRNP